MQRNFAPPLRALRRGVATLAALAACASGFSQVSPGGILFFGSHGVRESIPSTAPIAQVSCNLFGVSARRVDGTVVGWGDNTLGQMNIPVDLSGVVQVASGRNHTLALKNDGTVVAWGDNYQGQSSVPAGLNNVKSVTAGEFTSFAVRNDGTFVYWGAVPTPPNNLGNVVQIAATESTFFALRSDGTVAGWGSNGFGELNIPPGLNNVVKLSAQRYHVLALKADGTVVAWGSNGTNECNVPSGLSGVVDIAAGYGHSVALKSNGTVVAWGYNGLGQCNIPASATNVKQIAANYYFTACVKADGSVVTFGDSLYCQSTVPNFLGVSRLSGSYKNVVGLRNDGTVAYWGLNDSGQATIPAGLTGVTAVAAGLHHVMALKSGGTVVCWGSNSDGQLNSGTVANATQIAAGYQHSMARLSNGGFNEWGSNSFGQLSPPNNVIPITKIIGGRGHTLALKQDGTLAAWGDSSYNLNAVPAGLSGVKDIACGYLHNVVLKTDGTVASWGWDSQGQTEPPIGLNNVVQVGAGDTHSLALKADGTVVGWGADYDKQISPLSSITNAAQVIGSGDMSAVLLTMHVGVAPYQVTGGHTAIGTVYLANPAPAGGTTVNLSTGDTSVATVPATVLVPEGSREASFTVSTGYPSTAAQTLVYASLGTLTQRCLLTVAPRELTVALTKDTFVGGSNSTVKGSITLLHPAPAGGATVTLSTTNNAITVPPQVTVPAGQTTANFNVLHVRVTSIQNGQINAAYSTYSDWTTFSVTPFAVRTFSITRAVLGSLPLQATIKLNAVPTAPVQVPVTSSLTGVIGNTTVTVDAGTAQKDFTLQTQQVAATKYVTLSAKLDGSQIDQKVEVFQALTSVKFNTGTWYGGTQWNVTVSSPVNAPTGGLTVNLTTVNCQAPTNVTIPEGLSSVSFLVTSNDPSAAVTGKVSATALATTVQTAKTISPNIVSSVVIDPSTFVGSSTTSVVGTVTLLGTVAQDTVVTLTSSNTAVLTVPATVTITAGHNSATFNVGHSSVTSSKSVKVTATRLGVSKSTTVTVN